MKPKGRPHGAFVVSIDFELFWGVRDKRSIADYRDNLLGARQAVPAMLRLFTEHGVRATWAVVGLLFAESRKEMLDRFPARRPRYRRAILSPYPALADVGESERDDPFHYAPSLIREIAATAGQEIGTHTFSHYYCLEDGGSPELFRADLAAGMAVTRDKIGQTPRSIVFPRNQYDASALAVCAQLGITAYRGNPRSWAYRARSDGNPWVARGVRLVDAYVPITGSHVHAVDSKVPPVDVSASRYLRPYVPAARALEPLRVRRIAAEMRRAASEGALFHLWWHPHDFGAHLPENLAVLRRILGCFRDLRDRSGMESVTMAEVADRALGASALLRT